MTGMVRDLAGKRVLVLSDDDWLSRAISLNLIGCLNVKTMRLEAGSERQQESRTDGGEFDLIVLAVASPTCEPVLTLARASLTDQIGRVPFLIVSERPFDSNPNTQIAHVSSPLDVDMFHAKVTALLQAGA
jgi:hypothetical protein